MPLVFAIIAATVGAFALSRWYLSPRRQALRALRTMPRTRVTDARAGARVCIEGTLRERDGLVPAPLSGRRGAYYDLEVEARDPISGKWALLFRQEDSRSFLLEDDDGGIAIVDVSRFAAAVVADRHLRSDLFEDPTPAMEALLAARGLSTTGRFGTNRTLRYREGVLEPGERLVVVGVARWEDDPAPGALLATASGYRESARKQRLVLEAGTGPVLASDEPAGLSGLDPRTARKS